MNDNLDGAQREAVIDPNDMLLKSLKIETLNSGVESVC